MATEPIDVANPERDAEELLRALNERLYLETSTPLVIVFDTFEQVAARGPDVVHAFTAFVQLILATVSRVRIIVSGRGRIMLPLDMHLLPLKDLGRGSADAVLEAHDVSDPLLRARIIDAMGTSPLSLQLAARALASGRLKLDELDLFKAGTRAILIQGMLYTRVLGHVRDPEVERLAHPGMVVAG